MTRRQGFTLVELMLVMLVIGILAVLIIPSIRGVSQEADLARAIQDMNTIKTAVISYRKNVGSYPADIGTALTGASPQILEQVLKDPFSTGSAFGGTTTYGYTKGTDGTLEYFFIYTKGPNGNVETTYNSTTKKVDCAGDDECVANIPVNKT